VVKQKYTEANKKTRVLYVKVTEDTYEKLKEEANRAGMMVAEFVRAIIASRQGAKI